MNCILILAYDIIQRIELVLFLKNSRAELSFVERHWRKQGKEGEGELSLYRYLSLTPLIVQVVCVDTTAKYLQILECNVSFIVSLRNLCPNHPLTSQ
jgi:hypothetical protein